MPLASRFAFAPHQALQQAAQHAWWRGLDDPLLNELMSKAMAQNLDLARAQARIEAARALLGTVGINAQTQGGIVASATASKTEGFAWSRTSGAEFQPSFVIDLFGGQTRAVEAAQARVNSEAFDGAASRLAVQLELVVAYLDMREQQALIAERHRSIRNRAAVVRTLRARIEAGDALVVDLRRAEAELSTERARLPALEAGRQLATLQIATLLAEPVQNLLPKLDKVKAQPMPDHGIDPGVPAALLRNRPDIRRAEADFANAVAEIGVREAQLYPSLRIDGNLRASSVGSVSMGPVLSIPVLDRPARNARVANARAIATETQTIWRQTVLRATEEVQAALVRMEQSNNQVARLRESASKYRAADKLAREAFDLGSITLSEILDTERSAASVRFELISARLAYARAWAQLNVALGQGWYPPESVPRDDQHRAGKAG